MKISLIALAAVVALPLAAYAQETPEIRVSDGKVSITALSVPIGRLLQLLDRAVGMKSEVKPELTNRLVSVRFTNLELKDAVYKIFQGQPLNYLLIEGKGIRVTDAAQGGGATSTVSTTSSPFQDSQPIVNNPIPINPQPQPIQANVPVAQPAQPANPFGTQPPNAQPTNTAAPGAGFVPGQLPPPIGASNPLSTPANTGAPSVGFPSTPAAPPQPAGPGVLPAGPGALPGATVPGQIGR
jgi:hypothetical protein